MLIYLYGTDSYRRGKKLKRLVSAFTAKHQRALRLEIDFREEGGETAFRNFLEEQSLFGGPKLAIATGTEEASKELADLLKGIAHEKGVMVIVLSEKKLGAPLLFLTREPVASEEFQPLKGMALKAFIEEEARGRNVRLSPEEARALSEECGGETWAIVTELDKIALGKVFSSPEPPPQFFPLIQILKSGRDLKARLSALAYLLENEESAAVFNITASLADQKLKVKMADYDIAVKSGKLEYPEALLDLALS